jgi:hypothetical protein
MKKRLNVIVLVLEIAAIVVFHAVKINQSEKKSDTKIPATAYSSNKPITPKFPYILINVK